MIKKLTISAFCAIFSLGSILGQEEDVQLSDAEQIVQDYKDAWQTPIITDEMTVDAEQNKSWRMGEYKFSSKPKNCWELGFHIGHFFIDGDIDKQIPGGYGVGLHLRKAVNYTLSLRGSVFYGVAKGFESQPYAHRNQKQNGIGGGLVEQPTFDDYDPNLGGPGHWFPSHKTMYISADMAAVLNLGNLLFHKERNRWNWYMAIGVGLDHHTANLDLLDSNGLAYANLRERVNWTRDEFNTKAGRTRIKDELKAIYDGVYETEGFKKEGLFRIGDEFNIHFVFIPSMGISRKISKRLNIALEHQVFLSDNDYLDGIKYRTSLDQTNNVDIGHYTHIRVGLNLGNFSKVTEPLYWMNPLDAAFNDIANLKNKPILDLADEDHDGIIDLLDQELNTQEDCPVDTRGVILDSDGDGVVDCEDREPYSVPGCPVDEFGVAMCEDEALANEDEIIKLIDKRTEDIRTIIAENSSFKSSPDQVNEFTEELTDDMKSDIVTKSEYSALSIADVNKLIDARIDDLEYSMTSDPAYTESQKQEINELIDAKLEEMLSSVTVAPGFQAGDEEKVNSMIDAKLEEIQKTVTVAPGFQAGDEEKVNSMIDAKLEEMQKTVTVAPGFQAGDEEKVNSLIDAKVVEIQEAIASNPDYKPADEAQIIRLIDKRIENMPKTPVSDTGVSEADNARIIALIDKRVKEIQKSIYIDGPADDRPDVTVVTSGCGDWFLPMIHYDLNKSSIKPEYYSHLHNVAQVMKKCPSICVVANGHTDTRHNNSYNTVLSYKRAKNAVNYLVNNYGIDRSRIKLMYGGEENPMVRSASSEAHHFMNRRVEFRTCEVNDFDMPPPADYNPDAKTSDGSGKGQFKGNKSSGY